MSDWDSERVRALVNAAENAVQRTRWLFLVLTLYQLAIKREFE